MALLTFQLNPHGLPPAAHEGAVCVVHAEGFEAGEHFSEVLTQDENTSQRGEWAFVPAALWEAREDVYVEGRTLYVYVPRIPRPLHCPLPSFSG
jgi:hypothetical protein